LIYLDNAATSWPKPPEVLHAMTAFLECAGGNPGRSGHRLSIAAGRIIYSTRELLAELFHVSDPMRVIFTQNVTHALNLALTGFVHKGDGVVTSGMEHNSVMRPLRALENSGVRLTVVSCDKCGCVDMDAMKAALIPGTRLVTVAHASNVTGTVQPLAEIAELTHQAGALLLVDAAQTAGVFPIDQPGLGIDLLAFTGHKGLQGPPGTGGLVLGDRIQTEDLQPIVRGGTGSRSEHEEQPELLPDKYESGTPNGPGIAGLGAGVSRLLKQGVEARQAHEASLTDALVTGLQNIPGVTVYGPCDPQRRVAVVSFTIAGMYVSEIGLRLDDDFGVLCRVGLHCAPAAHRTIGTFPEGTVRLSPGPETTIEEIQTAIAAIARIAQPNG
jgi:cysteine desulfurase family protein